MQSNGGESSGDGNGGFDPEPKYNEFPSGGDIGYGRDDGYGELIQINDARWFTEEARGHPVINAFLKAWAEEGVAFSYLQLKSSTSESEWYIHKPHLALSGDERTGIIGAAPGFEPGQHIGTYVINHHRTLALRPVHAMVVSDGTEAGQIVHKGDGS